MIQSKLQWEYDSLSTVYGSFWDTLSAMQDVNRIYNKNKWISNIDEVYN